MRLITWNCQGAFRIKANSILSLRPDVLCLQEMESPAKIEFAEHLMEPTSVIWHGESAAKGLAVLGYSDALVSEISLHDKSLRHVLPVNCQIADLSFNIFNVWTKPRLRSAIDTMTYIDYVIHALPLYSALNYETSMFVGDFNADKVVTTGKRFEKAIALFDEYGFKSAYHEATRCKFMEEKVPTLYHLRDRTKPFHIDYAFCSGYWLERLRRVTIGDYQDWIELSDHMPVILDFEDS